MRESENFSYDTEFNLPDSIVLNLIVYLDVSEKRISNFPNQRYRDSIIIEKIFSYFALRQKKLKFNSNDCLQIITSNIELEDQQSQNFLIEMSKLRSSKLSGFYALEDKVNVIRRNINNSYLNAGKEADIWSFFRNDIQNSIKYSTDLKYENKIIIISDGYMHFDPSVFKNRPHGSYMDVNKFENLRNDVNWDKRSELIESELESFEDINFNNLNVLFVEVSPKSFNQSQLDEGINDFGIMKYIWTTWFTRMGLESQIISRKINLDQYDEIIKFFLQKTTFTSSFNDKVKLTGDLYQLRKSNYSEYVKDKKGSYWFIDIRTSDTKRVINFKSGSYMIDNAELILRKAINEFNRNVLDHFDPTMEYFILVKGSADFSGNTDFSSKLSAFYPVRKICYLPKDNNSEILYLQNKKCYTPSERVTNNDLPNLRAAFIQDFFVKESEVDDALDTEVKILEGTVTREVSSIDRNVVLILYVSSKK